jgi:hypothetical protein
MQITIQTLNRFCGNAPSGEYGQEVYEPEKILESLDNVHDAGYLTVGRLHRYESAISIKASQFIACLAETAYLLGCSKYKTHLVRDACIVHPLYIPFTTKEGDRIRQPSGTLQLAGTTKFYTRDRRHILTRYEYLDSPVRLTFDFQYLPRPNSDMPAIKELLDRSQYVGLGAARQRDFGKFEILGVAN